MAERARKQAPPWDSLPRADIGVRTPFRCESTPFRYSWPAPTNGQTVRAMSWYYSDVLVY